LRAPIEVFAAEPRRSQGQTIKFTKLNFKLWSGESDYKTVYFTVVPKYINIKLCRMSTAYRCDYWSGIPAV
jgi:hypothetical protein